MSAHVCFKFIKRVGEKRQNARLAEHDLGIRQTTYVHSATLNPCSSLTGNDLISFGSP